MDADDLRKALNDARKCREGAEQARQTAMDHTAELLRQVGKVDGLSVLEAADILGLSRKTVYELLKD